MAGFWKNRRVLVVGGAGFIGSHTVEELVRRGARVFVVDRSARSGPNRRRSGIRFYKMDAGSGRLSGVFQRTKPELVLMLAGIANVPLSTENPILEASVIPAMANLLQNAVRYKIKKVVYASSGFIYGNTKRRPTPETEPFQPLNPLAISKAACESYLRFFHRRYGLPFVILRYGTVYGPRQGVGAVAGYLREILNHKPVKIYGTKTRDYIFISDVVRANLMALREKIKESNPVFNISSGTETSLEEIFYLIAHELGRSGVKPIMLPGRPSEMDRFHLDVRKAKRVLSFQAKVSLSQGLKKMIDEVLRRQMPSK